MIEQIREQCNSRLLYRFVALLLAIVLLSGALSACSLGGGTDSPDQVISDEAALAGPTVTVPPTPLPIFIPSPTPTPLPSPTSTPLVQPTPAVVRSDIVTAIDALVGPEPGIYGVVVLDSDGSYLYASNATVPFVAASLFKLVLIADIEARIESGELTGSQEILLEDAFFEGDAVAEDSFYAPEDAGGTATIDDLLYATAAFSSNIAARALLTLTTPDALRATALSLGMNDTHFFVKPSELENWPDRFLDEENPAAIESIAFVEAQALNDVVNITTANDIARYWELLVSDEVVSPGVSERTLDLLRQQVITDRIPSLLPSTISTANKTGNLGFVVHDSGVLFLSDGPRVVVVLTQGAPDDSHAAEVIQRVALIASGETNIPPYSTAEDPIAEPTTEDDPASTDASG